MTNLLHDILTVSSLKWPDKVAIEENKESITFSDLDTQTTKLSNLLVEIGLKNGQRIGLLTHKSISSYKAIYAILKAGCAYVPLDRRAPNERLEYICNDCNIDTLLVTQQVLPKIRELLDISTNIKSIIVIDNKDDTKKPNINFYDIDTINGQSAIQSSVNIIDSDLAYILYTSGSTGKPKGVMISHHVSFSFVSWACQHTKLTDDDRVSAHAPLHFDLSIFDTFASIMAGATLVPVPDGASTFPSRLLDWILNNNISVWYSVPSILSMMVKNPKFGNTLFPRLRLVIFAGEVFPVPYLEQWLNSFPKLTFMNWFGPTETNVITSYTVKNTGKKLLKPIPIGQATANASLYCLDKKNELITEAGVSGELYARGPCVALGYWGDEKKTKDKFLVNQFNPYLADRTFKTGDIVMLDENNNFIFQGRNDHLVKSRGYRIELGEVEAAFYAQEQINQAAIIPFPDDLIGNKLVAFISTIKSSQKSYNAEIDGKAEKKAINQLILNKLPSYMIPSEIILLERLPMTSNGKVDRQKLTVGY